jgi:magnesium transporter
MSLTLYILTLVTTILAPTNLLASWFGMNFHAMPELQFKYSYGIFIVLNIALIACIIFFFKQYHLFF